jgi:hypothetical protein
VTVEDLRVEEYALAYKYLLIGTLSSPVVQLPPPIPDFTDIIPLHWATIDDTSQVSRLGVPITPTSTIVTVGYFLLVCPT